MLTGRSLGGPRLRGDAGSTLMLMPAAALIVIVLGAIAADLSLVHTATRDLLSVADSVAQDAVTDGVDPDLLRLSAPGDYPLRTGTVQQACAASLARQTASSASRRYTLVSCVPDDVADTVVVELEATVDLIFGRALPGDLQTVTVQARGEAHAEQS